MATPSWVADEFRKEQGIDLRQDRMALQRLKEASEKAKVELSSMLQTEINLPFITADASGPKHLNMTLSRSKLEQLTAGLIERSENPVRQAMTDAKLSSSDVDEVVLVGGMSRMPAVQESVRKVFGKDPNRSVNPDEVVAIGAAIQAGVLAGEVKDILLLDVTPLTLAIETLGGVSTPMIERNTTIPTRKAQVFSTASDGQTQVEIVVAQGERSMARDNKILGNFTLDGLPPAPRGVPQVEVAFDIDADGILHVSAQDKATQREQKITITASSGLSDDEIKARVKEAEQHKEEDERRSESVEARNQADSTVYAAEKLMKEQEDKVPEEMRGDVESKIAALKESLNGDDTELIKQQTTELGEAMQQVGAAVYQETEQTPPPDGETPPPSGDDGADDEGGSDSEDGSGDDDEDVVEGEFHQA